MNGAKNSSGTAAVWRRGVLVTAGRFLLACAACAACVVGAVGAIGAVGAVGAVGVADAAETAEQIVDAMIEAHGGYEAWAGAPSVRFEDDWGERGGFLTTVETGRRRAYLDSPHAGGPSMVWDGEKAWSVNWPEDGPPPRFLALLNFHFLNLPWLVKDPGVILAGPESQKLFDDATDWMVLRVTYDSGVGDTPDDWYELYIHPTSYRLKACRYVVTYDELLPEGVDATPPHILVYDEWEREEGLMVPSRFTIYEEDGSVYAKCVISGWSFSEPFDESRMAMPPGAMMDESHP